MLTHASPVSTGTAQLPQVTHPRNPGMPLDLDWVAAVQANTSAIERRAATLPGRRSRSRRTGRRPGCCKAITLIDLTTLSGDDTEGRVQRLCAKARQPVRAGTAGEARDARPHHRRGLRLSRHGGDRRPRAGRHRRSPSPPSPPAFRRAFRRCTLRIAEIGESVKAGAREIDIVISRRHVLTQNWQALYDETRRCAKPAARRT